MHIDSIKDQYLVNFTEKEKAKLRRECIRKDNDLCAYEGKLLELIFSDSPDIFANHLIEPNTPLEVRYHLNRVLQDDPTCTHLLLSKYDGVGKISVGDVGFAFMNNTHCRHLELSGLEIKPLDLMWLLNALKNHPFDQLTLDGNQFTPNVLEYVSHLMDRPQNPWCSISLGKVKADEKIYQKLDAHKGISYTIDDQKDPSLVLKICRLIKQRTK